MPNILIRPFSLRGFCLWYDLRGRSQSAKWMNGSCFRSFPYPNSYPLHLFKCLLFGLSTLPCFSSKLRFYSYYIFVAFLRYSSLNIIYWNIVVLSSWMLSSDWALVILDEKPLIFSFDFFWSPLESLYRVFLFRLQKNSDSNYHFGASVYSKDSFFHSPSAYSFYKRHSLTFWGCLRYVRIISSTVKVLALPHV